MHAGTTPYILLFILLRVTNLGTLASSAPILLHLNNQCSLGSKIFNLTHTVHRTAEHGVSALSWTRSQLTQSFNDSCRLSDVVIANQRILSNISVRSFFVGPQVTPVCPLTDTIASYTPQLISVAWVCWRHRPENDVFSIYPSTLTIKLNVMVSVLKFFKFSNLAILYQFDFNWFPFAQRSFSALTSKGFTVRLLENYATVSDLQLSRLSTDSTKGKSVIFESSDHQIENASIRLIYG